MNFSSVVLFISAVIIIITTGQPCPRGGYKNDQPQFGQGCIYRCHCVDDVLCDSGTGNCPGECAAGWMGPGCQYGDIAHKKTAKQRTTRLWYSGAEKAVDGNVSTCSQTTWLKDPWWRLDLGATHRIFVLVIHSGEKDALKGFEVRVGNVSSDTPSVFPRLCFKHNFSIELGTVFYVVCELEQIGQHIMIQVPGRETRINLCDVRVYGVCRRGLFGVNCDQQCGNCAVDGSCSMNNGTCIYGCLPGWTNNNCNVVCPFGWFGQNCSLACGHCINDSSCHHVNGTCKNGCSPGYNGSLCDKVCPLGWFGQNCSQACGHCANDSSCHHVNGTCISVCSPGYNGSLCNTVCPLGWFGQNCSQACGHCINESSCHHVNGTCTNGCSPGYNGSLCDTVCPFRWFGQNCSQECGHCVNDSFCHPVNGTCADECSPGYDGSLCNTECLHGFYGKNCTEKCGVCFNGTYCNHINGICKTGCASGYTSELCKIAVEEQRSIEEKKSSIAGAAVGGALGAIMITSIVVWVIVFWRRRRPSSKKLNDNIIPAKGTVAKHNVSNTYENISAFNQDKVNLIPESVSNLTYNQQNNDYQIELTTTKKENEIEMKPRLKRQDEDQHNTKEETEIEKLDDTLYNETSQRGSEDDLIGYYNLEKERIIVDEIADYVIHEVIYIKLEFKELVSGPQSEMNNALRPTNRHKNRYKGIYAYDKTRVVLEPLIDDPDSDYINACFIGGYNRDKAYIAAQGPTVITVNDFWRMIWQNNIKKIVMLTGLYENGKHKCHQYWPSEGSVEFGKIHVDIVDEDICTEYTSRFLQVTQTGSTEQKMVVQFHFTAWLDRDVPDSPAGLLQFLNKVRQTDPQNESPTLVHCSAGIGRTGTYIAIDYLYEEGTAKGSIHVFDCVNDLRRQRVGMVQNAEQYLYIHEVLVEALVRSGKRVDADEFPKYYQQMKEIDPTKEQSKIQLEFDSLQNKGPLDLEQVLSKVNVEDEYASAKLPENRMKNRYSNIVPSRKYRPFLSSYVLGCNNYINGLCLPTRKNKNGLLLTQTPLPATVVDFWRLIFEYEVETLVSFHDDNLTGEKIGNYWPIGDTNCQVGPFTVTTVSETRKSTHLERVLQASKSGEERSLKVKQFVCNLWKSPKTTPGSARLFLNFLEDVEDWQRQSEHRPIIVHCLNGAERSGLFCVLWCILERVKVDRVVAIRSVVKQMRVRRQQIIPNFAQYQFCHDVILEYLTNFVTYTNI